jgi:hypothetical protein
MEADATIAATRCALDCHRGKRIALIRDLA